MGFAASIHALIQIKSNPGVESQRKKHKLRRKRRKEKNKGQRHRGKTSTSVQGTPKKGREGWAPKHTIVERH